MPLTRVIRRVMRRLGYSISRVEGGLGGSPFDDMALFLPDDRPLIFDVGANVGQSIRNFRARFRQARIHSFEPSPSTFATLKGNAGGLNAVSLWNCALGATPGQLTLIENTMPEWSSFLPPGKCAYGRIARETQVPVTTVDSFCAEQGITAIDVLKSDTQGYEFEVFQGAGGMFRRNAIRMIYCELIFSELYKNMPSFGRLYDYLTGHGFLLVSFYSIAYEKRLAGWTDGLFVHRAYLPGPAAG